MEIKTVIYAADATFAKKRHIVSISPNEAYNIIWAHLKSKGFNIVDGTVNYLFTYTLTEGAKLCAPEDISIRFAGVEAALAEPERNVSKI